MNPSPVKVTKKKVIEKRRCLKHSGKPYTTSSRKAKKGKELPSVTITCKCRYGCKTLSKEYRDQLFMKFYKISYKDQGTYLLNRIQVAENMMTFLKADVKLLCTIQYPMGEGNMFKFVAIHSKTFLVCQLGVFKLQHLKKQGKLVYEDRREKVPGCNAHKKSIVMVIGTLFDVIFCHSFVRLYTAFKKQYPQSNVTRAYYVSAFKEDFSKLKFARPRTDTCNKCDKLNASVSISASPKEKRIAETQLQLHILKSDEAKDIMRGDTIRSQMPGSSVTVFAMDLEQVLFVPTITHSRMFYSRQLSSYNLCIHDSTNNESYMNTWHEGIADRGGNEIRVSRSNPNEISHKEDFSDLLPFSPHKVFKKNKNHSKLPPLLKFSHLPTKYGISVEKKKDLLNLCDYLKEQKHRDFYRDLCADIEMNTGNFDEDDG
ncbi:hypothetical protein AVEN_131171-1 [Araneus ventricosus]|uniref:Uncharacterized protein n=1 Tax=Araneus ventricosus TaxID=182803 RepID=A0A4Y2MM51_ARAVE|nr:hypothetical protein AVEN_131171-1 [Araneus ventricosus]